MLLRFVVALGALAVASGCDEPVSPVRFENVALAAGITYVQGGPGTVTEMPSALGASGGAAVADFDQDGLPDIYVTRVDDTDILYRNRGDGTFDDVTTEVGLTSTTGGNGAAWGDIDNDGDLDLYVSVIHATRYLLFVNDGTGHFTEEGIARNAVLANDQPHMGWTVSFGDYDRDGWLDIHLPERQEIHGIAPSPSHTRLLRNLGALSPGHFEDVTIAAGVLYDGIVGVRSLRSHTFMSTFSDIDDDGWPDLLVASDFGTSRLFWNDGDGTFTDGTVAAGVGTDDNGMGSSVGDYDGDGLLDWFVDSISCPGCEGPQWAPVDGNRMYRYVGGRTFEDATDHAGVRDGWWGWGTAFFDYDNDGDLDLVQTNGVRYGQRGYELFHTDPIRLWENQGGGRMREVSDWVGMRDTSDGRGAMVLDFDDDGDLDLFIVNHAAHASLWRNDGGNANAWCRVRLVGTTNRQGIGARVYFQADPDGPEQVTEVRASGQYLGQSEVIAHFGMGPVVRAAHRIRVRWPTTGVEQVLDDVECNRTVVIAEPAP